MVSRTFLILLCVLAGACSAPVSREGERPLPPPPAERPPAPAPPAVSAVDRLLADAQQALDIGELERAESILLRAQRVDPRNARVYLGLARLYQRRGDAGLAANTAERGLLYCEGAPCAALRAFLP